MTGIVGQQGSHAGDVVIGVDTHQDEHVAVAIDRQGVRLGELHTLATMYGYRELERWSRSMGEVSAFGIEGTGSYGTGVARFMAGRGYIVVEVNRPDRSTRYRKGKSDPTDAEMAARAVLSGVADATPNPPTPTPTMWKPCHRPMLTRNAGDLGLTPMPRANCRTLRTHEAISHDAAARSRTKMDGNASF